MSNFRQVLNTPVAGSMQGHDGERKSLACAGDGAPISLRTIDIDLVVGEDTSEMSRVGEPTGRCPTREWVRVRKMDSDLVAFLSPLTPFAEEMVSWPSVALRLACYRSDSTPPRRYVTSARAIVIDGDRVLVVQDPTKRHIMPGGRLEPDETPEDALRREVLEETGWSLAFCRPIGVLHYTHIDPMPEGWSYPYPDFLQIVYASIAGELLPRIEGSGWL